MQSSTAIALLRSDLGRSLVRQIKPASAEGQVFAHLATFAPLLEVLDEATLFAVAAAIYDDGGDYLREVAESCRSEVEALIGVVRRLMVEAGLAT